MMDGVDDVFELRITWRDSIQQIGMGLLIGSGVFAALIVMFFSILHDSNWISFYSYLLNLGIAVLMGGLFFVVFIFYFSVSLIYVGIRNAGFIRRNKGVLYRMDREGFVYHENWQSFKKTWQEVSDVGLFKQESKKVKVLYKYQVKFSDGTCHTFDLRGTYPTKEFNSKIEDYWLKYSYE